MTVMQTWNFGKTTDYEVGPWTLEPDKCQWIDEATGYDCLIVRNQLGALCGYVGVPPGHPLHGEYYDDVDSDVHGGLTFSNGCDDSDPEGICHIPAPGRPADVWWFGFDCAHSSDVIPGMLAMTSDSGFFDLGFYRDVAYVKTECAKLAQQLVRLS